MIELGNPKKSKKKTKNKKGKKTSKPLTPEELEGGYFKLRKRIKTASNLDALMRVGDVIKVLSNDEKLKGLKRSLLIGKYFRMVFNLTRGNPKAEILARGALRRAFPINKNSIELVNKGIDAAVKTVVAHLRELSKPIGANWDEIANVGAISANNDEAIGKLL